MKQVRFLTIALAAVACLSTVSLIRAEEPEYATVALFFNFGDAAVLYDNDGNPVGLSNPLAIVFEGPPGGGSTGKSLSSVFPVFGGQNLNALNSLYIHQKGAPRDDIVRVVGQKTFGGSVMQLGANSNSVAEYAGRVSESSDTFEEDSLGGTVMIIVTGEVH